MAIIEPETDIKLWISIISQSIQSPDNLNVSLPSLKRVFFEIIENPPCLPSKYKISETEFYQSIVVHILNPVFRLEKIIYSNIVNSNQIIIELLNSFVNFSILSLYIDDPNLKEIVLLLFNKTNKLYQLDKHFFDAVCNSFIDLGLFPRFLDYLDKIPDSGMVSKTNGSDSKYTIIANKIPFLAKSLMSCIPYVEQGPEINRKSIIIKCMNPLVKLYQYINDKTANFVFCQVFSEMIEQKQIRSEIMNFWVEIFILYLKIDSFSLVLFTLTATTMIIKREELKTPLFLIFKQTENRSEIIKLYLNISIHEEFCKLLQDIYPAFLNDGLITIDDLSTLWKSQQVVHISLLPSLLSIFVSIAATVSNESSEKFTNMILNNNYLTEEWLKCVVQIALKLNNRKHNVSKYTDFFTRISNGKFNFGSLNNKEIESFKKIAEEVLPQLVTNSFDSQNYLSFLRSTLSKINTKQDTKNDIEILCNSLPNFSTGSKKISIIQEIFEKILSIFPKYNISTMKKIVEILVSERYSCTFGEQLIKRFLQLTSNEKICSEIYSFVTDLCLQKNRIPVDVLLKVMINSNIDINSSFYQTIKSIILTLNEGGTKINEFPFIQEDIIWHFCFLNNSQIKRFHKLLSRIYMNNTTSDKEMIESFVSNSIIRFKKLYYQKNNNEKSKCEAINIFCHLLETFLDKIESYIFVPFNYHFSEHKENKIQIQINKDIQMKIDFDQRKTVSSLIHYIQITNKIDNDILIKYQNNELNEKKTIIEEIGLEKLNSLKNENKYLLLSIIIKKTSNNNIIIRHNRTYLPSLFIVNNIKGILNILFQSDHYPNLFYKLPTFNETRELTKKLKSEDFQTCFPYDNPIKFQYNFESFLDFYSSNEFSLLQNENINDSYHANFIKESGLIDYLINCGLSTSFPSLIHLILSFIKDYYNKNNDKAIDNEILGDQFISLIEGFLKPDQESYVISNIFAFKLKSLPGLSQELLFKLLTHKIPSFRKEARIFLKEIEIPLSYYGKIYDELEHEPQEEFYYSMGDHVYLSKKRDERVIKIITINCQRKNPYPAYLYCIDAALKTKMFNSKDEEYIANYIANNFIIDQLECPPKYCFNNAMQITSYFQHPAIINAIYQIFNIFNFSDHLIRKSNYENVLIDGDAITFRGYTRSCGEIKVNYENFPIGLKNLGATCYINAVLQQLFNINDFRDALANNEESSNNHDLANSLNRLFYELQASYLNVADPSMFLNTYGVVDKKIQCDCCEFLQQLIDRLKINIFEIRVQNTITAIDDEQLKAESYENCDVLSLPIRNLSNIDESFKHFSSIDFIKNFTFENCKKCDAKKAAYLESVRNHIIIQLKRFEFNHQLKICEKINSTYTFGEVLNFGRISFKLTGVIVHIGESADNGHYISYVRKFNLDQWFEYNDSEVTRVNKKFVMETAYKNGYILFYTKDDSESFKNLIYKGIKDKNKYEVVCRMIFSNSLCNTMMQICKKMNSSNIAISKISIFYFFQFLPIYLNKDLQSNFGSVLLSKCKKSKENNDESFISTLLYTIFQFWSAIKMQNSILYAENIKLRRYSCDILKLVINHIECTEEILKLVQESSENWFYYLYSSNEIFELLSFAFEKNPEKMIQISKENNWGLIFENLFISVIQCKKINFEELNLHYFIQLFIKIRFTDKFETVLCKNIQFIPSLLGSKTPINDIISIFLNFKRKEEAVHLLNEIQPKTQPLITLLSKIC